MPSLGQKNTPLSTLSDVSNADLSTYVGKLKKQENGRNPDIHKINGNMAWYARAKDNSHPMNQYFNSFGRNAKQVLEDLKSRVPEAFGLKTKAKKAKSSQNDSSNESERKVSNNAAPPDQSEQGKEVQVTNESQQGLFGMSQTMTYAAVGGGLLLLTVGAIAISN